MRCVNFSASSIDTTLRALHTLSGVIGLLATALLRTLTLYIFKIAPLQTHLHILLCFIPPVFYSSDISGVPIFLESKSSEALLFQIYIGTQSHN